MNIWFEWIFWISKKMNICFEWIFWIFIKWIICWINILVLVCPRQKWLSPNVSNSSEIIQGSLVGPISVHFRVSITYYSGLRRALKPYFGLILEFWIIFLIFLMNNSIKYLLISSRTVNCSEYEATLSYSFIVNSSESIAVQIIVQLLHWTSSVI